MSVSQSRITRHPERCNCVVFARSRLTFAIILSIQYGALCPRASRRSLSFRLRPCQKSPSQKTASLGPTNTTSGLPGKVLTQTRYRRPAAHRARRKTTSHLVFSFLLEPFAERLVAGDAGSRPRNDGGRFASLKTDFPLVVAPLRLCFRRDERRSFLLRRPAPH
jgi:hypothetical protein